MWRRVQDGSIGRPWVTPPMDPPNLYLHIEQSERGPADWLNSYCAYKGPHEMSSRYKCLAGNPAPMQ